VNLPGVTTHHERRKSTPEEREAWEAEHVGNGGNGNGGAKVTFSIPALAALILALLGVSGGGVAALGGGKESVKVAVIETRIEELTRRVSALEDKADETNRLLRIFLQQRREEQR
jgi:hypothetical protein